MFLFFVSLVFISILIVLSYLFVFIFLSSAWGEGLFLAIQTAIIAALVLLYGSGSTKGIIIVFVTNSFVVFPKESFNTFSTSTRAHLFRLNFLIINSICKNRKER